MMSKGFESCWWEVILISKIWTRTPLNIAAEQSTKVDRSSTLFSKNSSILPDSYYIEYFSLWTWWKFSRRHHHTNKDFVVWNMQYYFRNDKSLQWRFNIWQSVAPGSSWNKRKISRFLSTHWCCEKIGSIIIIIPSKSSLFYHNLWIYSTELSYNKESI